MPITNFEKIETLPSGLRIIKFSNSHCSKYTISDEHGIKLIKNSQDEFESYQLFDTYSKSPNGDIIFGIYKSYDEFVQRVIPHIDLCGAKDLKTKAPFNPSTMYDEQKEDVYKIQEPTKKIEDIIPEEYKFIYGVINDKGIMTIFPTYDSITYADENSYIVGEIIKGSGLRYGYADSITGTLFTPICFQEAGKYHNSRSVVKFHDKFGYTDRYKFIDNPNVQESYPPNLYPKFYSATPFYNGEAKVTLTLGNAQDKPVVVKYDINGNLINNTHQKVYPKQG